MKNLIFIFLLFSSLISLAQSNEEIKQVSKVKKWKATNMHYGLGVNWAHYDNITLDGILAFAKNPDQLYRDLSSLDEEISTTTGSGQINANLSFSPYNKNKSEYNTHQEIRFGFNLYTPREAMVSFKNQSKDSSIVYCNLHGEVGMDAAYLFRGGKKLEWTIGIGYGVSLSFSNKMVLLTGEYYEEGEHPSEQEVVQIEEFAGKNVYYTRFFIPLGLHYHVSKKIAIGLECRFGSGKQHIQNSDSNRMTSSGAFILGTRIDLH